MKDAHDLSTPEGRDAFFDHLLEEELSESLRSSRFLKAHRRKEVAWAKRIFSALKQVYIAARHEAWRLKKI